MTNKSKIKDPRTMGNDYSSYTAAQLQSLITSCEAKLVNVSAMFDAVQALLPTPAYVYEEISPYRVNPPDETAQKLLELEINIENFWMRLHALHIALQTTSS